MEELPWYSLPMALGQTTIVGVDLGGTKIAAGIYDASGNLLASIRRATPAQEGFARVLDDVVAVIGELRGAHTDGVGVGVPGLIRFPEGIIARLPNIPGAEGSNLRQLLEHRTGLRTVVENDASCFTLAEALYGAGRGEPVVLGVTMGTGVGGGIVIQGKLFHGAHGFASEFGHMLLRPGHPPYPTDDARGDVEQFLSGTAFGKRCTAAGRPEDYLEGDVCHFLRPEVFREVAWLCTNLTHAFDPSVIVFGGSAGRALQPHLSAIADELDHWLLPGTPAPRLAVAQRDDAAMFGAALLCVQERYA